MSCTNQNRLSSRNETTPLKAGNAKLVTEIERNLNLLITKINDFLGEQQKKVNNKLKDATSEIKKFKYVTKRNARRLSRKK